MIIEQFGKKCSFSLNFQIFFSKTLEKLLAFCYNTVNSEELKSEIRSEIENEKKNCRFNVGIIVRLCGLLAQRL